MYQAGVDFGTISLTPILHGVVATVLYFLVGAAVLVAGFLMVNLLTPGDLRRLVFIDRRPNAVVLAATMYVALAIVTIAAIYASSNQLAQGPDRRGGVRNRRCRAAGGGTGDPRDRGAGAIP